MLSFAICRDCNINVYSLLNHFYSNGFLCNAYSKTIHSLGDPKQWHASNATFSRVIFSPRFHRRERRLRINRILSQGKERNVKKNVDSVIVQVIMERHVHSPLHFRTPPKCSKDLNIKVVQWSQLLVPRDK